MLNNINKDCGNTHFCANTLVKCIIKVVKIEAKIIQHDKYKKLLQA
jgi:hypothetical protein